LTIFSYLNNPFNYLSDKAFKSIVRVFYIPIFLNSSICYGGFNFLIPFASGIRSYKVKPESASYVYDGKASALYLLKQTLCYLIFPIFELTFYYFAS